MDEEVVIPFPNGARRDDIRDATRYRSTWISTSVQTLRANGLYDAYFENLPPERREDVQSLVAGVWMPMEFALAHYRACDALGLDDSRIIELGRESSQRAHSAIFSVLVRAGRTAGVTPWTSIAQAQKLWSRSIDGGGGVAIFRLGPKEARYEMVGFPPARVRYVRVALRGIVSGVVELFAKTVFVRDVPSMCGESALAYRISWV